MVTSLILVFGLIASAYSQPNWYKPPEWNQGLPDSMEAFHANGTWLGKNINASYVTFDLKDPSITFEVGYTPGDPKTPS